MPVMLPYGYNALAHVPAARVKPTKRRKEVRPLLDCPRCGRYDEDGKPNTLQCNEKQVRCGICGTFIRNQWDLVRECLRLGRPLVF